MVAIRQVFAASNRTFPIRLLSSKAGPLVDLAVDNEGIATLAMQRAPVNSINLGFIRELNNAMDEVRKSEAKAMILTSALPSVFSGGVDINEIYKPDSQRFRVFLSSVQDFWIKLFGSDFITAAAINGHAPGAGCLFAMSCEYRSMVTGKWTIGLNEIALGLAPSLWVVDTAKHVLPMKQCELALTAGKLYNADEALQIGLIDETASDKADAVEKCKQYIRKFDRIPPHVRALTKKNMRDGPIRHLIENKKENTEEALAAVKYEGFQQSLEVYIENLKQKSAKKGN